MLSLNEFGLFFKHIKVLYVEDDEITLQNMKEILEKLTDHLHVATNGKEALKILENNEIDLIITDIEMPETNGIELIKTIRRDDLITPIVVQTAYSSTDYLYKCANLNIQAYLTKPINFINLKEVLYKILNYINEIKSLNIYLTDDLEYDRLNNELISKKNGNITLTKKEGRFISLLLNNKNRVVNFEEIGDNVWQDYEEVMTQNSLRTLVKNLRKKVGEDIIINLSGIGYKIVVN